MNDDAYLTIAGPSEGLYKEKGSKFLSFAFPASSEGAVKEQIDELKKQYHDARHHCYAFILGRDKSHFRASDAGEPNHSAGDPILGQIRSRHLTDTLVVVVRYFGGVKLGVSGLINAYKTAAADALDNAEIVEKLVEEDIGIQFDYAQMNDVMRLVNEYGAAIKKQDFDLKCRMTLSVRKSMEGQVRTTLTLIKDLDILK